VSQKLEINETIVKALEMVWAEINNSDDISIIRRKVAAELLFGRIALDFEKNGKLDNEKIKEWYEELS
jgi:hypothetical protein